jgi:hypothetical protein
MQLLRDVLQLYNVNATVATVALVHPTKVECTFV